MAPLNIIIVNIFALVVMALPAYILIKLKLMKDISGGLTFILLYICQPLLIFVSLQNISYSKFYLNNMLYAALLSFAGIGLLFLISMLLLKKLCNEKRSRALLFGSAFSNSAFMGLPLIYAIFGENNPEILLYANVFIAFFNFYSWTIGVYAVSGDKKYISFKKALLNPATISLMISLPLFFLNIKVAGFSLLSERLFKSISDIAHMITPLSMFVIGMKLAQMNVKEMFLVKSTYFATFIKLIISPLLMLLLMLPFDLDIVLRTSLVFSMAMPSAMTTVLFSELYGADTKAASSVVLISTILCMVTIPLISLLI